MILEPMLRKIVRERKSLTRSFIPVWTNDSYWIVDVQFEDLSNNFTSEEVESNLLSKNNNSTKGVFLLKKPILVRAFFTWEDWIQNFTAPNALFLVMAWKKLIVNCSRPIKTNWSIFIKMFVKILFYLIL